MAENGHAFKVTISPVERSQLPKDVEFGELKEEVATEGFVQIKVTNFSAMKDTRKHYFDDFEIGGKRWRLLFFPQGNSQADNISLYLDLFGPKEGKWATCAQFLVAIPHEDGAFMKDVHHRFCEEEVDWGFTSFLPKKTFYNEDKGKRFIVDDTVTFYVGIRIVKDPTGILWHNFVNYDSKQETGFVGLKNQGATCYMNSILQSLYFVNYLRRAVFRMPTDDDDPAKSIPLALQRVFYHLQHSDKPVGTTELTKSFGWDAIDSFMQHDVQEFNRVLCDKLETKMKGTPVEGSINFLLEGKMKSYVRCTDVEFESSREESYYDVQLNVKGLKNLKASFDDYIAVETLDGDNKYQAEGHGLQRANKGVIFKKLPPVLHLQLKRFEYDMMKDAMVKINDRHEFPETIDLTPYLEESDRTQPNIYHLHGVLVHSGDLHGGHYCAFLRPEKESRWFKFDDDRVTPCLATEAMDDNFGIDPETDKSREIAVKPISRFSKKFTNAYMLVYFRESDMDKILCPVSESDISESARARFKLEQDQEEQKRKEKEEQHLHMPVRVVTEEHMKAHHLQDLCVFDVKTETPASALSLKIKKEMTLGEFKTLLAETIQTPPERQRLWSMPRRQNSTIRPDEILELGNNEKETMISIRDKLKLTSDLRIFVEKSEVEAEGSPRYFEPFNSDNDLLIFLKYYDPVHSTLRYKGHMFCKLNDRVVDIVPRINEKDGRPVSHPLKLYEEVRPTMIEKIKAKDTFKKLEIGTGDIIVYCEELTPEQAKDLEAPTPPHHFENLLNSITVHMKDRNTPKELQFSLQLSKKMKYDQVAAQVAKKLNTQPNLLRFVSHNNYTEGPKHEFKYEPEKTLEDMLQPNAYQSITDILYYEMLDMPITELEKKKQVVVAWVTPKMTEEGPFKLLVDKDDTVEHLLEALKTKIKFNQPPSPAGGDKKEEEGDAEKQEEMTPLPGSGRLRFVEVFSYRISKVFNLDAPVKFLNDYSSFYAEEIPREELDQQEGDKLVSVFHFHKDPYTSHGTPFLFLLKAKEPIKETLERLRRRLHVTTKEFEKYKFALVSYGRTTYFTPDQSEFQFLSEKSFSQNECLGIDRVDKTPRQSRFQERSVVIRN